jgi:hypothetical protein
LKGLAEEDKESGKYNLSRERVEYEIGQRTTTMKTIDKIKSSSVVTSIRLKL